MKVNVKAVICDLDDKPIKTGKKGEEETLTLATMAVTALLGGAPDEKDVSAKDKIDRFNLAMKIRTAEKADEGEVDIPFDDVKVVRELVGKTWSTLPAARALKLLEFTGS